MKNIISFIIASASLMFGLTSCSKDNLGMEDIFNGNDKTVIAPLDFQAELGNEAYDAINQHKDLIMQKNISEVVKGDDYQALIINRQDQLDGIVDNNGNQIEFPEVDFEKYSIIMGAVMVPQTNYFIANQRVIVKDGSIKYYIEISRDEIHGGYCTPYAATFCSVYGKLPEDRPVEVFKWVH